MFYLQDTSNKNDDYMRNMTKWKQCMRLKSCTGSNFQTNRIATP